MDPLDQQIFDIFTRDIPGVVAAICLTILLVYGFLNRNMPRVGGKLGRRAPYPPADPPPQGFSRVDCRHIVTYLAPAEPDRYATLKTYLREGTQARTELVHVYRVAGCRTRIEVPAGPPHYERIDAAEALALWRELPDPRLVWRLHLSDEPAFLDPWWRRLSGRNDIFHQGHANNLGLVVIYLPDRRLGPMLGTILVHEWAHLLAYRKPRAVRRFKRANKIEPLPPLPMPLTYDHPVLRVHETWAELGEKLLGYDDKLAREAALQAPVHAMILWRCVEKSLRKTPKRLASTRRDEFKARGVFMRAEVAPKARAVRRSRRWWRRLYASMTGAHP